MKITPLDKLFSQYIRMRAILRAGGCERCGAQKHDTVKENGDIFPAWKQLQCAHLISRWHKSTKWDEDVALGLCGGCHLWIDHEAEEKLELLKSKIGQDGYYLLQARARATHPKPDEELLTLYYKEKIKALEVNDGS